MERITEWPAKLTLDLYNKLYKESSRMDNDHLYLLDWGYNSKWRNLELKVCERNGKSITFSEVKVYQVIDFEESFAQIIFESLSIIRDETRKEIRAKYEEFVHSLHYPAGGF